MIGAIRPVRPGILIGLIGILFGIGWAFWLVLGHERIHSSLEAGRAASEQPGQEASHHAENRIKSVKHMHSDGKEHMHAKKEMAAQGHPPQHGHSSGHDDALMELTHTCLMRGHLHAMGLGLGTIIISVVLSFTSAQAWIKTAASLFAGIGGLIYPLAWIVMGYRTPSMGPELAEASVTLIAGPGVVLVLSGVLAAAFHIDEKIKNQKIC